MTETAGGQAQSADSQGKRQEKVGVVTSNKMQKTVVVTVERQVTHPLYKRVVRRSKNFLAHDEKNECRVGDTVQNSGDAPPEQPQALAGGGDYCQGDAGRARTGGGQYDRDADHSPGGGQLRSAQAVLHPAAWAAMWDCRRAWAM